MTEYEHYLFDLNGYLVVENMLGTDLVRALNEAIDHHKDQIHIRGPGEVLHGGSDALKGSHGRGDFHRFLNWDPPWCQPFRDLISLPPALRYMVGTIGDTFRLDSTDGMTMTAGSEGFVLHGGGTPEYDVTGRSFYYRFENGRMHNGLMAISYSLTDVNPGDGGFVCVPGSHKANHACPPDVRRMEMDLGCVNHIPMKAGDGLIFTEALTHGTLPWSGKHERRVLIYRYTPAVVRIGDLGDCEFADELTPLQRALIEPPSYVGRASLLPLLEGGED